MAELSDLIIVKDNLEGYNIYQFSCSIVIVFIFFRFKYNFMVYKIKRLFCNFKVYRSTVLLNFVQLLLCSIEMRFLNILLLDIPLMLLNVQRDNNSYLKVSFTFFLLICLLESLNIFNF